MASDWEEETWNSGGFYRQRLNLLFGLFVFCLTGCLFFFVSFEIKVIELPVKHPELFEALGIDQPKVRFKLLPESQFYKQHVNDKILYTVLLSRKFPTVLDYWGP